MASNYKFSDEEMAAIKAARRETKDKRADARLKALELRAEGMELSEVSQATGFHAAYVSQLVAKYRDHGLEAISGNHYGGNHRNMSFEEEAAILAPFKARAEKGELVEISEIETAYQQAVGHSIGTSQIYYVLHPSIHTRDESDRADLEGDTKARLSKRGFCNLGESR